MGGCVGVDVWVFGMWDGCDEEVGCVCDGKD